MKVCSTCKVEQLESEFRKDKYRPDGLTVRCKSCHREYESRTFKARQKRAVKWREENKEHQREISAKWYEKNKDRKKQTQSAWRSSNLERDRTNKKKYYENNRGKFRSRDRRRLKAIKQATPKWANWGYIELWYELARREEYRTGRKVHVDHIIPITNDIVCGLNCEHNMQLLFAEDNLTKSNKFDQETCNTI